METELPVCMLANTPAALNAALSHSPDTVQQSRIGMSECAGSMSSRNRPNQVRLGLGGGVGCAGGGVAASSVAVDSPRGGGTALSRSAALMIKLTKFYLMTVRGYWVQWEPLRFGTVHVPTIETGSG